MYTLQTKICCGNKVEEYIKRIWVRIVMPLIEKKVGLRERRKLLMKTVYLAAKEDVLDPPAELKGYWDIYERGVYRKDIYLIVKKIVRK